MYNCHNYFLSKLKYIIVNFDMMLAENEPENNLTKSKWNYLESLVDKANEVFKVPKRTNYLDSDNSDGYVSKEESQKRISMIFISLALLLNVVLVSLIVLHLEVTKENQTQMIFHDYEGNILFCCKSAL